MDSNKKNRLLNQIKWRKLDNTAKIFPIISSKKFSNIFRLSVILKEDIKKDILQKALDKSLETFKAYKVKLKRGFFWYYFETNLKKPIVEMETDYPCKYISAETNNDFLFKVTYYKNKINLEIFHSITDGNGAIEFLKLITYNYIELVKNNTYHTIKKDVDDYLYSLNAEDSYIKNYDKHHKSSFNTKSAYNIKGKPLPFYATGVIHGSMSTKALLSFCKSKNITIGEYFTAKLIYAIYHVKYKNSKSKKNIKIFIPVNLKNFFDSKTVTNFFSYITVDANIRKENFESFEFILNFVKKEFKTKLNKKELTNRISNNVSAEKNIFVRLIPLVVKKYSVKLGYIKASTHHTTTLSNLGKINIINKYKNDIDSFLFLISPSLSEKIKCSICSYMDSLVVTFCSCLENTDIENYFFDNITNDGIDINVSCNSVYENFHKKNPKLKKKNKNYSNNNSNDNTNNINRNIAMKNDSLYPINNIKKSNFVMNLLLIISFIIITTCVIVNMLTTPNIHWSFICIIGIIYTWITTIYSIKKNKNIAFHVLLQSICVFLVTLFIDISIGYKSWSLNFALPIILMASNVTMITLLIVTRKKYFKYMIYQIVLSLFSTLPFILLKLNITENIIFTCISSGISLVSLILTIILCSKEFKAEIERRFHF